MVGRWRWDKHTRTTIITGQQTWHELAIDAGSVCELLHSTTSRQQQTPWNVEEKRPIRPGNHVCEWLIQRTRNPTTTVTFLSAWTNTSWPPTWLRSHYHYRTTECTPNGTQINGSRVPVSTVTRKLELFKEYASVVDKQQTCMSWRRWRSRKIKSGEYVLITRYVEYVWICVSEWTKLFSHNSEKNELLESMVHPLEVMRRELKDIVKGSMEVSYIITTNVPHKMTSQYLSSPQLHNWFPMMSSVNDWNWCTDQMEKWQGLSNFLPM